MNKYNQANWFLSPITPWITLVLFVVIAVFLYKDTNKDIKQKQAEYNAAWTKEKEALQDELKALQQQSHTRDTKAITANLDPVLLVEHLYKLDQVENQTKKIREALYCLQGLIETQDEMIEPLRGFLASGYDITLHHRDTFDFITGSDSSYQLHTDKIPYTVRMGIFHILRDCNTDPARNLLVEQLSILKNTYEWLEIADILIPPTQKQVDVNSHTVQVLTRSAYRLLENIVILTDSQIQQKTEELEKNTLKKDMAFVCIRDGITQNSYQQNIFRTQILEQLIRLHDKDVGPYIAAHFTNAEGEKDLRMFALIKKFPSEESAATTYTLFNSPEANKMDREIMLRTQYDWIGKNALSTEMFQRVFQEPETTSQAEMLSEMAGFRIGNTSGNMSQSISAETAQARLSVHKNLQQQSNNAAFNNLYNGMEDILGYYANPTAYSEKPTFNIEALFLDQETLQNDFSKEYINTLSDEDRKKLKAYFE